MSFVI
jgi:hypothetical protein